MQCVKFPATTRNLQDDARMRADDLLHHVQREGNILFRV